VFSERVWIVKSPSLVKSIINVLYRSGYSRSICDSADGSICEILNCVSVRANVE
jgi:hypothetical protein